MHVWICSLFRKLDGLYCLAPSALCGLMWIPSKIDGYPISSCPQRLAESRFCDTSEMHYSEPGTMNIKCSWSALAVGIQHNCPGLLNCYHRSSRSDILLSALHI